MSTADITLPPIEPNTSLERVHAQSLKTAGPNSSQSVLSEQLQENRIPNVASLEWMGDNSACATETPSLALTSPLIEVGSTEASNLSNDSGISGKCSKDSVIQCDWSGDTFTTRDDSRFQLEILRLTIHHESQSSQRLDGRRTIYRVAHLQRNWIMVCRIYANRYRKYCVAEKSYVFGQKVRGCAFILIVMIFLVPSC